MQYFQMAGAFIPPYVWVLSLLTVCILIPLGLFPRKRIAAGRALIIISYVFGAIFLIYGALVVIASYRAGFLFILLAMDPISGFLLFLNLLLLIVMTIGSRILGMRYRGKLRASNGGV
jgi:hypothetical protein